MQLQGQSDNKLNTASYSLYRCVYLACNPNQFTVVIHNGDVGKSGCRRYCEEKLIDAQ